MKPQCGFLKFIVRFGFLAKGAVYLAVGLLALQVAVGFGGETNDPKGALEEIGRHPFGATLLLVLAVSLLHYSAWKFVEAFKDPEHVGKGLRVGSGAKSSAWVKMGKSPDSIQSKICSQTGISMRSFGIVSAGEPPFKAILNTCPTRSYQTLSAHNFQYSTPSGIRPSQSFTHATAYPTEPGNSSWPKENRPTATTCSSDC
jgi:hypothetical protein